MSTAAFRPCPRDPRSIRDALGPPPDADYRRSVNYADLYPWPDKPWLRTMMVSTLDGATVGADGRSGSISGPADKRVFMETRRLSDAVLVGAGTIRAERYKPMLAKAEWQEARLAAGRSPAPQIVVVSGRLDLPWEEPMFAESALPVIVATTESVDTDVLTRANEHAEVWQVGTDSVDLASLVTRMHAAGLRRIVCEGGEVLLDGLVRADLVDEMDLTVSPLLAGAGYLPDLGREVRVPGADDFPRFSLAHQFSDEGFTFCRFIR